MSRPGCAATAAACVCEAEAEGPVFSRMLSFAMTAHGSGVHLQAAGDGRRRTDGSGAEGMTEGFAISPDMIEHLLHQPQEHRRGGLSVRGRLLPGGASGGSEAAPQEAAVA